VPSIAVFGKHPGWPDHMPLVGTPHPTLVRTWKLLYEAGVQGNIDEGAWGDPAEAAPEWLSPYGHVLLWRLDGDAVVGRVWSSRDQSGRDRYPMIGCAVVPGLGSAASLAVALPILDRLEATCRAAATEADVRSAVSVAERRLSSASATAPGGGGMTFRELAAFVSGAGLAAEPQGRSRVLYEIDREVEQLRLLGDSGSATGPGGVPQHVRGRIGTDVASALHSWYGLLAARLPATAPILAVAPSAGGWIDTVIGEPGARELFCLRVSPEKLPPASDVPYQIDPAFVAGAEKMIALWREDGREIEPPPKTSRVASAPGRLAGKRKAGRTGRRIPRPALIAIGLTTVAALLAVVAAMMPSGSVEQSAPTSTLPAPPPTVLRPAIPPRSAAETAPPSRPSVVAPTPTPAPPPPSPPSTATPESTQTGPGESLRPAAPGSRLADIAEERPAASAVPADVWRSSLAAMPDSVTAAVAINELWRRELGYARASVPSATVMDRLAIVKDLLTRLGDEHADVPPPSNADPIAWLASHSTRARHSADAAAIILSDPDVPLGDVRARMGVLAEEQRRWRADVDSVADAATEVRSALEAGLVPDERIGDEGTALREGLGRLRSDATAAGMIDAFKGLWTDVDRERSIAGSSDLERLMGLVGPESPAPAADSTAAWLSLLNAVEAGEADTLLRVSEALPHVRRRLDAMPAAPVAARLHARTDEALGAAWRKAFDASAGLPPLAPERLADLVDLADRIGPVAATELDAAGRASLILSRMRRDVSAARTDPDVRLISERHLGELEPLRDGVSADAGAFLDAVTTGVRAALAGPAPAAGSAAEAGPGVAGWSLAGPVDDEGVEYAWVSPAGRSHALRFIKVVVDGAPVMVSRSEMSVGLFGDLIRPVAEELPVLMAGGAKPAVAWEGPRSWQLAGPGGASAPDWAALGPATPGGLPGRGWLSVDSTFGSDEIYASATEPAPPTHVSPMQGVTPEAAALAAARMGCRLPTVAEWAAALATERAASATTRWNLRDAAWKRQWEHTAAMAARREQAGLTAVRIRWPAGGRFAPAGTPHSPDRSDAAASSEDDGSVFFEPVDAPRGERFAHLVGNVAEYVLTTASASDEMLRPGSLCEAGVVRVVGGSALSPPGLVPEDPQPIDHRAMLRAGGYSDVGFRLAYAGAPLAERRSLAERVVAALQP